MRTLLAAIALTVLHSTPAHSSELLDRYMALRVGSFTSADQAAVDSRYDTAIWHVSEVWAGSDPGRRWLYLEAWLEGADAPYMQRLSSLSDAGDGSLVSRRYRIDDASAFLGLHEDAQPRQLPTRDSLRLTELAGCDAVVVPAGENRFESGTFGNRCGNRYKGASYAISRSVLHANGMTNWDRGFNDNGELVWGPAAGGYRFTRVEHAGQCVQPVRMLVFGTIADRARFGAYVGALAQSGLYPEHGGYYEAISPVVDVFEGEPPANRGVVIARFPCLEKAQAFWNSDAYQAIVPLRRGASDFEVIVLNSPVLPGHFNGPTPE